MQDRIPTPPGIVYLAELATPGLRLDHPNERWFVTAGVMSIELCVSELLAAPMYALIAPATMPWLCLVPWLHLPAILLARRGWKDASVHWNCAVLWSYCLIVGYATGGAGTIGMISLTTVPLVPTAMLQYRQTMGWSALTLLTGMLAYHPSIAPWYSGPGLVPEYAAFGSIAITALISSVALAVIWQITFISAGYAERLQTAVEELERARGQAEAANDAKDVFLASMSHELRTPMNGVVGVTGLLMETELDEVQAGYATTLRQSATALLDIVNEVLDFARIEANMLTLEPRPTRPIDIVEQVAGVVGVAASAKGLDVQLSVDDAVPTHVGVDPGRLRQVLYNLVGNAVKFTEEGHVRVCVRAKKEGERYRMCIAVSDTGPGIPEEMLPTIFDRFVRVGTSGMGRPGTGLGLAIARGIVESMDGELTVQSELGIGTTFAVELMVDEVDEIDSGMADDPTLAMATFELRVLLAEDNIVNQKVATAMLQRLGCTVEVAPDGRKALDLARQIPFDLVLMDCEMPGMDGFDASRGIRGLAGRRAAVPIVALTAHVLPESRAKCFEAGMDDFVSKPFTLDTMRKTLARWCPDSVCHAEPKEELEAV